MLQLILSFLPAAAIIFLWMPDFKMAFTFTIFYLAIKDVALMTMNIYSMLYFVHKDKIPQKQDEQVWHI